MKQECYAHIRPDPEEPEKVDYQTVKDHLLGTAERCAAFAGVFQAEQAGRAVGLVHDWGKCTPGFQKRLLCDGPKVDHATAGALLCARRGSCSRLSAWPGTTAGWRMWAAKGTRAVPPCLPA